MKRVVDRQGGRARFLLAGSVSSFLLPPGTETLTGRAHRLSLMPLAAAEFLAAKHRWLAELLVDGEPRNFRTTLERSDVFEVVTAGGYPAALRRATPTQRTRWFASYLATVTDRDLPDLVDIRHSGALSRLYRLIAQRTSSTAINTELSQALDISQPTTASYRRLLERLYLTMELPGWTVGVSAKAGHRAKVHVTDTGLAAGVLSLSAQRLATTAMGGAFSDSGGERDSGRVQNSNLSAQLRRHPAIRSPTCRRKWRRGPCRSPGVPLASTSPERAVDNC